jgi:anti-sigma B factor antagonist
MSLNMIFNVLHIIKRPDDIVDYDTIIIRLMATAILDGNNAGDMSIFMKTLIQGGAKKVIVDMTGLDFIDSSGISVLIEAAKMLRQIKGDIALINVPERVQVIIQPIKLNRFIKMFNTEDEVINFFKLV